MPTVTSNLAQDSWIFVETKCAKRGKQREMACGICLLSASVAINCVWASGVLYEMDTESLLWKELRWNGHPDSCSRPQSGHFRSRLNAIKPDDRRVDTKCSSWIVVAKFVVSRKWLQLSSTEQLAFCSWADQEEIWEVDFWTPTKLIGEIWLSVRKKVCQKLVCLTDWIQARDNGFKHLLNIGNTQKKAERWHVW